MNTKQVIVIRKDLKMRKGKMVAQGAHASMKVFFDRNHSEQKDLLEVKLYEYMIDWVHGIFTKIVVGVNSEEELHAVYAKAKDNDILVH